MSRIQWSDSERNLVGAALKIILRNNEHGNMRNAIDKAQEVLPQDRRRNIASITQIPWINEFINTSDEDIPHQTGVSVGQSLVDQVAAKVTPILEAVLEKILTEEVIQAAMDRAVAGYLANLNNTPSPSKSIEAKKIKKKKMVVINMLKSQFNILNSEFKDVYDMILWTDGENGYQQLRGLAQTADKIYGMTSFMRHSVDSFLAVAAKDKYVRFTGGMSSLKNILEQEYCNS